jgi:hypothetical protein
MTKKRRPTVRERIDAAISAASQRPAPANGTTRTTWRPDSDGGSADWPKKTDDTKNSPTKEHP